MHRLSCALPLWTTLLAASPTPASLQCGPDAEKVVVIAEYDEFKRGVPGWALSTDDYCVDQLYQRRFPGQPRYIPNNGFEGGVYLRWVMDHYTTLPPIIVFTQADAKDGWHRPIPHFQDRITKVTRDNLKAAGGYIPLNDGMILSRTFATWAGHHKELRGKFLEHVEECWRHVAGMFGRADVFDGVPTYREAQRIFNRAHPAAQGPRFVGQGALHVTVPCCNFFVVSRERVRSIPLATWTRAYEQLIVNATCVPGRPDYDKGKHEGGGALEHLAHIIWGASGARYKPHKRPFHGVMRGVV